MIVTKKGSECFRGLWVKNLFVRKRQS